MENKKIIAILKNIRRFDKKEKGCDYFAGWDNCLDTIIMDFKEESLAEEAEQLIKHKKSKLITPEEERKDIKRLVQIAKQLISVGVTVEDRNGLPYCKNCGLNLVSLGIEIERMTDRFISTKLLQNKLKKSNLKICKQ